MRRIQLLKCVLLVVIAAFLAGGTALAQSGGGYDLTWSTIDGGGGTSTGGSYELSGTTGQWDAVWMSGGGYTLAGGFWPGSLAGGSHRVYLPLVMRSFTTP